MTQVHTPLPATASGQVARLAVLLRQAGTIADEINHLRQELAPLISQLERPQPIPEDQAWFWTEEWQAGEREVDEALKNGEYKDFDSIEALLTELHAEI